jgi:hypothetical protein
MMHVLEQPLVLSLVLQYAGPDQWLFLGAVSKAWAALHTTVLHQRAACRQRDPNAAPCNAKATSFAAAAASLARVLYACDYDAMLRSKKLLPLSKGAASCGSSDVLIWAKATASSKWLDWHQELCMAAAAGNQLATLQWLRTFDPEQQWEVLDVAAKAAECAGLPMLQWILEQQPEWSAESARRVSAGAARGADALDRLVWLFHRFEAYIIELSFQFAVESSRRGAVASLQWLALRGFPLNDTYYATTASAGGQLAALRFLVEVAGCPWDVAAVRTAAIAADDAEILQWASSADEAAWTTAVLSELLLAAAQDVKLRAADWLRDAGAEWPASFLYEGPAHAVFQVWPVRSMQWARANGCPWESWDGATCTNICSVSLYRELLYRQATQDAMLWAHAAGCPCGSWRHRFAGRFVRKSSTSSSSSSSSHGDINGDVYSDVDTHSRWNAVLFTEAFTPFGRTAMPAALLRNTAVVFVVMAVLAAAVLLVQPTVTHEERQKQLLESLLMIWSDKHVLDFSVQRTQLIRHYMQDRSLLSGMSHDTCINWDAQ